MYLALLLLRLLFLRLSRGSADTIFQVFNIQIHHSGNLASGFLIPSEIVNVHSDIGIFCSASIQFKTFLCSNDNNRASVMIGIAIVA